ncbi:FAD-binding oxidoreductase [Spirosoma sp. RP8]|uniref:FAD-binding oxidoreductase n=1 Tax=Spirosoma liriopis TaxID=2937440 RepID=A0ABT0HJP9_9BACT|nr:FAD-binding oxidoreductase [Spirosoma liriopis]MCK8492384.1 FAD-binding oxidoreductase [Spirosoma liriopis]
MNRLVFSIVNKLVLVSAFIGTSQAQSIQAAAPKTHQVVTPATYKGKQIVVGSGGGFTGFSTTYYLLDNGQIYGKRNRDTTFTLIGKQTVANTKRAFTVIETKCQIKTTQFNNPGNTYQFVQWRQGGQRYKVAWGEPGKTVPPDYPRFFDSFMAMIPATLQVK